VVVVTERKPADMSFPSWVDKQISEAAERGAFDNLPGAGKPLPRRREGEDEGQLWLRDYLRREGVSADVMLPEPLKLRKEAARLTEIAAEFRSEREVREAAADLNDRIIKWRRIPVGPPIFVALVDEDELAGSWREARAAAAEQAAEAASTAAAAAAAAASTAAATEPVAAAAAAANPPASAGQPRTRWWRSRRPKA
jgi:hypothetical protein